MEDAKRRDFTINGMFYDPINERVLDFVGGERDLAAGIVRAIGDPSARMEEDKLRMLRAVRFAATFEFHLDEDTASAVRSMARQIDAVSAERIAAELRRMLEHNHRDRAIQLTADTGLLTEVLPELKPVIERSAEWSRLLKHLQLLGTAGFPLALAALFAAVADAEAGDRSDAALFEAAGKRLRLSNREITAATWLLTHRDSLRDAGTQSLAQLKRTLAQPLAGALLQFDRADRQSRDLSPDDADYCAAFVKRHSPDDIDPAPLLTGRVLIAAGHAPGPKFKDVLEAVRDAQLNLEISTPEEAATLAERLLADQA